MQTIRRMSIAGALVAVAGLVLAAPGQAAPRTGSSATAAGATVAGSSSTQAGYVVPSSSARALSAGWTQPAADCGSADSSAVLWVGLTNGKDSLRVGTAVDCRHGKATYYAVRGGDGGTWHRFGRKVLAGDHLTVSMDWTRGSYELDVSDDTEGWGQGEAGDGSGDGRRMTRAAFVVQARSDGVGTLPLAKFGTAAFDTCTVNGKSLGHLTPRRLVMKASDGTIRATPGAITTSGDFDVAWKHS